MLEKTLESPLDCKEIQPVHPKGNKFWIFIGRTDAEVKTPILWPPDVKNWLIGKDPDAGKDWRREEKGMTENDGWMASPTQWMWVWVGSGSWGWTGKPGVLQSMGSQKVEHEWLTDWPERNWAGHWLEDVQLVNDSIGHILKEYSGFCVEIRLDYVQGQKQEDGKYYENLREEWLQPWSELSCWRKWLEVSFGIFVWR